jgi:hypothetical protein
MKSIQWIMVCFLALSITTTSCSNDDDDNNNGGGSTTAAGFYYGENGVTPFTKADEAVANTQYKTIIAKNGGATVVEMVLPSLATGTYSLATQYAFTYVKDGGHWEATAGSVTITKNENNKISGNYEATAGAGVSGITSMKGTFTDVPVN